MTLGSAMAKLLLADNDEDREKASKELVEEQGKLVKEGAKMGVVVTFGNKGRFDTGQPECE